MPALFPEQNGVQAADHTTNGLSSGSLRDQLRSLIENKEKQLVLVGTLGQRFLTQQVELEERIQQMDEAAPDDSNNDGLRSRLSDLATTMKSWESENQQMWASALSIGSQMTMASGDQDRSVSTPFGDHSHSIDTFGDDDFAPPPDSGPSAAQSSRRAKNAGINRPNTVEFATEIGNQLTREIRRVQALLSERDKALQDLKEERDDLERTLENLRAGLREREAAAEKFKDENWNLEYQVQELQSKLSEALTDKQRAETEQKRVQKQLVTVRETADSHKTEAERLQTSLEELKAKHETDIAQMRKTNAGLQREKSDLQTFTDTLKAEMAQKARAAPNRFGSPVTPSDMYMDEDDVFTGGNSRRKQQDTSAFLSPDANDFETSPDPSPSKPPIPTTPHSTSEVDALKQSLAHAHRQMSSLKSSVQREKELKLEYRRRLTQENGPSIDWEDEDDSVEGSPSLSQSRNGLSRGHRRTPRSKTSGKLTLAQKLGMAAAERALEEMGSPDRTSLYQDTLDEFDDDEPSPFIEPAISRPTSIDGMDPAFANVLRSGPSAESMLTDTNSPLKESAVSRRARGGAAFGAEPRPTSLVDAAPTALSAELGAQIPIEDYTGVTDEDLFDHTAYGYPPKAPTVEIGIQCDPVEDVLPIRTTAEVSIQCEPIEVPLAVETADASVQFAPTPTDVVSSAVQTEDVIVPVLRSISIGTEAAPLHVDAAVYTPPPDQTDTGVQTVEELKLIIPEIAPERPIPVIIETRSPPNSQLLPATSEIAVPRASFYGRPTSTARPIAMLFEDESENETETESEYVDARESEATPSSSVQDFHSFQTRDDSDAESVRTSIATGFVRGLDTRARHDSHATTRAIIIPPKPETKEVAMQTDPWSPPSPAPSVPSTVSFSRAGSAQPFQFIPPSPVKASSSSLAFAASIVKSPVRESGSVFISNGRGRASSIISNGDVKSDLEDMTSTSIASIASIASIDKTRPPTMSLPPPPSMPPPSTIPSKKTSIPPPRPTSPPPPELIQRATTPTFGRQSSLMVPAARTARQSIGSQSQAPLRQPPSTSSFRSSANPGVRGIARSGPPPPTFMDPMEDKRQVSQTSLLSGYTGPRSRRPSIASSRSSERGVDLGTPQAIANPLGSSTDPAVIHSITQTMIGEFLYKYTRRVVGKGHGEKRHKRFFWVHPYTKTLYWSSADPGASNVGESNAKSAYIDAVKQVIDPNPLPPGLHQYSIIVYTPQREMKFTAPTKERHDIWFKALSYLLDRPAAIPANSPAGVPMPASPLPSRIRGGTVGTVGEDGVLRGRNPVMASPASVRSALSNDSTDSWNLTPRARGGLSHLSPSSVGRRTGTPAAEYLRTYSDQGHRVQPDAYSPTRTSRSLQQRFEDALDNEEDDFENIDPNTGSGDFQLNLESGYEGIPNVRACCEGEHDLGDLMGKGHHHHHHHHHHPNHAAIRPSSRLSNRSRNEQLAPGSRPVSPSAFSGRSRSGSQRSDGASLFNLRFGSKRSTKSSAPPF